MLLVMARISGLMTTGAKKNKLLLRRTGANELNSTCRVFFVCYSGPGPPALSRSLVPYQQQHLNTPSSDMFLQVFVWAVTHFAD